MTLNAKSESIFEKPSFRDAAKTNRCVVVEESWPLASISSEIAYHLQRYAFDHLDAPVMRVTQTDTPFAFSPTLIDEALPNTARVINAVKSTLYRN